MSVKNKSLQSINFELINLNDYNQHNQQLKTIIDTYNDLPELDKVIGHSDINHSTLETGCFYTDAVRKFLKVDVSFQNTGGVRALLEKGNITKRDIYNIAPFNNGMVVYEMSVEEIKQFLLGSESGFYYSGIFIQKVDNRIEIRDLSNKIIPDESILKVGINDYIPAVHLSYFPDNGVVQPLTAAETIIAYLEGMNSPINYSGSNNYFKY